VLSALGLMMADVQHDYVRSRLDALDTLTGPDMLAIVDDLAAQARADLTEEGFADDAIELDYTLDMRYRGQGYEVPVKVSRTALETGDVATMRKAFDAEHLDRFGHAAPEESVEVVSYRVTGRGLVPEVKLLEHEPVGRSLADAQVDTRPVRFGDAVVDTPIYARELLDVGVTFTGPAIVDQEDTTVVVLPGQPVEVDRWRNLRISPAPKQAAQNAVEAAQ
jgi:N-methylhydantoinase A